MIIRKSVATDRSGLLSVHEMAFGEQEGNLIRDLVEQLLEDRTAEPRFSYVAAKDDRVVGHVLFTRVVVKGARKNLSAQILAPLAVLPGYQSHGIGSALVEAGIADLKRFAVNLVFVLGYSNYYPRFGFTPAGEQGFDPPYPIAEKNAGAWMVKALVPGIIGVEKGIVHCAETLNAPEHWRE